MYIRPALPADIPALCALLDQLFAQEAEFTPERAAQQRGLAAIIDDPAVGAILLAVEGERIVAMVNLLYTISTALGARVALLEDMVVDAGARGAGLGSALLEYAIGHARDSGCRRITLLTDGDNAAAQRFYQRHGFGPSPMIPLRRAL
ncbi:AraC family transcriptional regulator, regulatory protein of adaptative response / methylated-DNA-[protein]-cysteine methyltransferase [Geopseudomonas sagittaria]|uniref:AraC family transcriptional regulator, regulatory protein of adaptative response / methylated-DNA-[protein]-cysteine methyltransferase n=1 Tax=Geopseudomonas sagittaria TaxID=1135990 RepID=A0A1I5NK44_9GAMM|nr:GNAT family N-acetyltransferase [Pseudomonas sagittaria]MCM2331118.1 GNAT family N-acetyltransferase [Pseudomonas sagittaria]SFP22097.1 AraC family transcriptional regulator, regulatory protein of adaptative response / methylated-DNA-[protein]-cysteine methyltransferase [Pseudomonas sagittaria]